MMCLTCQRIFPITELHFDKPPWRVFCLACWEWEKDREQAKNRQAQDGAPATH